VQELRANIHSILERNGGQERRSHLSMLRQERPIGQRDDAAGPELVTKGICRFAWPAKIGLGHADQREKKGTVETVPSSDPSESMLRLFCDL
jgi:hypothetical protein